MYYVSYYMNLDNEQLAEYQTSVRTAVFDPEPGSMGMSYEKTIRKNSYANAVASILSLCHQDKHPFSNNPDTWQHCGRFSLNYFWHFDNLPTN